jgi:pyruvate/2-oxoglutarate dehydrogenase complex dihydrolipoamide acyltransferase (E2) component
MRRTVIRPLILVAATCGATAAFADSRLFSARSEAPNVTIDQALINGQPLAIAGKGGGVTFFRIDSLDADVPCANRVVFVTSDGQRKDFSGDFCALDWQVTLPLVEVAPAEPVAEAAAATAEPQPEEAAATPAPLPKKRAPVAKAPAPAEPEAPAPSRIVTAAKKETITIKTDGPAADVRAVLLDGEPVAITGQKNDTLTIEVASTAGGIECHRNLGFNLADGRSVLRPANICANGGAIAVALSGEDTVSVEEPVAEDEVTASAPAAPEPLPAPAPDPAPAAPAVAAVDPTPPQPPVPAPGPIPQGAWSFAGEGGFASLSFGLPESDATEFSASCKEASSKIDVELAALVQGLQPGEPLRVTFRAGAFNKTYPGVGSPVGEMSGQSQPKLSIPARDPLWQAIAAEQALTVLIAAKPPFNAPYTLSLKGSAQPARRFLSICLPQPPAPPPGVAAGPGGGMRVSYSCRDGSALIVTFDPQRATAVIAEPGAPPVVLFRTPSQRGDRFAAGPSALIGLDEEIRWTRFGERPRVCAPNFG